jgi:hypothetical protein
MCNTLRVLRHTQNQFSIKIVFTIVSILSLVYDFVKNGSKYVYLKEILYFLLIKWWYTKSTEQNFDSEKYAHWKIGVAVSLQNCIQEVPSSNLNRVASCFVVFLILSNLITGQ